MKGTRVLYAVLILQFMLACEQNNKSASSPSNIDSIRSPSAVDSSKEIIDIGNKFIAPETYGEIDKKRNDFLDPNAFEVLKRNRLLELNTLEFTGKLLHTSSLEFAEAYDLAIKYDPDVLYMEVLKRSEEYGRDTVPFSALAYLARQEYDEKLKQTYELKNVSTPKIISGFEMSSYFIYGTRVIVGETDTREEVNYNPANLINPNPVRKDMSNAKCVAVAIPKTLLHSNTQKTLFTLDKCPNMKELQKTCDSERFELQPAPTKFTGFYLKDSYLIATGHSVDSLSLDSYYFVFDYILNKASVAPTVFRSDQVFTGIKIIHNFDSLNGFDYSIITLKEPVDKNRLPAISNHFSSVFNNFYVIGSPTGIPLKLAKDADLINGFNPSYFTISANTFQGNSGSPVFNSATDQIEGYVVKSPPDFKRIATENGFCGKVIHCPRPGCTNSEGTRVIRISEILKLIK